MIQVRRRAGDEAETMPLAEFERRARAGEVLPDSEVCFPPVTGDQFVSARELELFRGLFAPGLITFKRYFHLGRFPWLTLALIGGLCLAFYQWQGGRPASVDQLMAQGAKVPVLVLELGHWWRLLVANVLHVSAWHLAINCLFLFNLGGPAEAVFRRLDYALILVSSAMGTTVVSALANPAVTCGASGLVFGVWGATATFGLRYQRLLPERYRRYFMGMVVPYSVFALYLGFATPGIDNWGHLGGLVAGSMAALALPPRLLRPADPLLPAKLLGMAVGALVVATGSMWPAGPGALEHHRYYPAGGLLVPVPHRWERVVAIRDRQAETYAFDNGAGVVVALETRLEEQPVELEELFAHFMTEELSPHLQRNGVQTLRMRDPVDTQLAGLPAKRVRAELYSPTMSSRADYLLVARGFYRYVVSFNAPVWLDTAYDQVLEAILAAVRLGEPDDLAHARRRSQDADSPATRLQLAQALAYAGQAAEADRLLDEASQLWPEARHLGIAHSRLLWRSRTDVAKACALMDEALRQAPSGDDGPSAEQLLVAVAVFEDCGDPQRAEETLRLASRLFPDDPALSRRLGPREQTP